MDGVTITSYLKDLINAKFISKEDAIEFAEAFKQQGKISEEQYNEIMELIDKTY